MSHWTLVPLVLLAAAMPAAATPHAEHTARVVGGDQKAYLPVASVGWKGVSFEAPVALRSRLEGVTETPLDSSGTSLGGDPAFNVLVRLGLQVDTQMALAPVVLRLEYEHDLLTGFVTGHPAAEGVGMPNHEPLEQHVRKAFLRASLARMLHVMGGLTTNHWGLGLVANDGDHGWHAGSADFADPRGGDRVLRVMLASGPLSSLGISVAVGHDWVQGDDVLLEGDSARQFVGAFQLGMGRPVGMGFYGAYRTQDTESGGRIEAGVLDLHLRGAFSARGLLVSLQAETVLITGSTSLAPSSGNPEKDILQIGAAARASVAGRSLGLVLDLAYASGDADLDDSHQNAFRADPGYELSLLLFRHVLAAQTGLAARRAADPKLVGYASLDLDRYPTRESVTSSVVLFPRAWWRPLRGLEVYGGPLVAFTPVPIPDPLETRLAGGEVRNALGGDPGSYLGTELDLGARFQMMLWGTELTAGVELGVLFPGDALVRDDGSTPGPVFGGRGLLAYRF